MIPIAHKNFAKSDRILAILRPDSAAAKRLRRSAEESGLLITATNGRITRSLILMETNHVILSALTIETLKARMSKFDPSKRKRVSYRF